MMFMRPPHHGHGWVAWSVAAALSGGCGWCAVCTGATAGAISLTRPGDGLGLGAAGQQTEVPDAVASAWQDVHQEPPG